MMDEAKATCLEETGKILFNNNQDIVKYLCSIQEERNTLDRIIQQQYQERRKIEAEIEKLTYKLCLINKSLSMRIKSKNNYDKTIEEIKIHYDQLVTTSTTLRQKVENSQQELDDIMNKKIGTGTGPQGEEIKMLYVKLNEKDKDECPCVYMVEPPTKDNPDQAPPPPTPFTAPVEAKLSWEVADESTVQPTPEKDPGRSQSQNLNTNNRSKSNNLMTNPSESKNVTTNPSTANNIGNISSTSNNLGKNASTSKTPVYVPSENGTMAYKPIRNNYPLENMGKAKISEEDIEIEMSSIKPDIANNKNVELEKPFRESSGNIDDVDRKANTNESKQKLLSKMRESINKLMESTNVRPRTHSILSNKQDSSSEGTTPDSSFRRGYSYNSYESDDDKIEQNSNTDIIKATSGIR